MLWLVSVSHSCQAVLYLETRFNKRSASRLEAGIHHSITSMLSVGLYKGIRKSLLAISRWRRVLIADSQFLRHWLEAVSLDKPPEAVCMSKLYFLLSKKYHRGSLVQSNPFPCAEGRIQRGTQLNMCLGSCDSFLARSQTVQYCNLSYLLFQKHLSLQGKQKWPH